MYLVYKIDARYRYRRAREWPGMAGKEAIEGAIHASPKTMSDTDYTDEFIEQECEARGLKPPHA